MKTEAEQLELLWRYADGNCNSEEEQQVQIWLASDEKMKQELDQIEHLSQRLKSEVAMEEPSMRFRANVMEGLADSKRSPALIPAKWKPWLIVGFLAATLLSTQASTSLDFIPDWSLNRKGLLQDWLQPILDLRISAYTGFFLVMLVLLILDRYLASGFMQERRKTND